MLPHKVIFRIPLVSVSLKLFKLQQFSKNKAAEFNSNALEIKNSSLIINILLGLVFVITSFFLSIGLVRLIKTQYVNGIRIFTDFSHAQSLATTQRVLPGIMESGEPSGLNIDAHRSHDTFCLFIFPTHRFPLYHNLQK